MACGSGPLQYISPPEMFEFLIFLELVAGALACRPGRPVIFLMTGQSAPTILGVNLPKYRMTYQNFRGSSQNFRTFGGFFHGFGYLTPLHCLNHWPAGQPANGRNFRPARPTPDLVVGHKL